MTRPYRRRRHRFNPASLRKADFHERLSPANRQRIDVLRIQLKALWFDDDVLGRIGTEMMAILDAELGTDRHNKWRNVSLTEERREKISKHSRAYWQWRREQKRRK